MSSPIRRCSIRSVSLTMVFMSSGLGWMTCFRLNASNWLVRPAACSPAFLISCAYGYNGVSRTQRFKYQLTVAVDESQQVIEVMCHTSGQPAHAFELLGLSKLALQLKTLGDVYNGSDRALLAVDFNQLR